MKVKDLIKMDIDIDVYDNVCEELSICFCGPLELTEDGEAYFTIALNLDVETDVSGVIPTAIVNVEDEFFPDLWKFNLKKAREFFYSAAGYCKDSDWDRWFVENNHTVENNSLLL